MKILKMLSNFLFDYKNKRSLVSRLRQKRLSHFSLLIDRIYKEKGGVRLLDLGGTISYWERLPVNYLESKNVHITVINLQEPIDAPESNERYSYLVANACDLNFFDDLSFDLVHSNSVIEHVGDWQKMKSFANEARRLAPYYYVQVPHYWFPFEPHFMLPFFHWLPKPWRVSLVLRFSLGYFPRQSTVDEAVCVVECARLLDFKMFEALFPDARMTRERLFFMTKSLIATRG